MLVKYSFMDIFSRSIKVKSDTGGGNEYKTVRIKKIVIPIIQRDYAQGRSNSSIKRVRENFLNALFGAVTDKPITLDFIYGDLSDAGILIPLDGQQRLTTLFLLHWYAARKEKIPAHKLGFLQDFSYETRPDARDFCEELINFEPEFRSELSKEIKNQSWFPLSWKKDPTISAMLTMLDAIDKKFSGVQNLWRARENYAVTYYFMPIKDMGLTDEIYITMNSRGKLLTEFEHFKAEFKQRLDKIDAQLSNKIIRKIDSDWTDLLWQYRDAQNLVDDGFLNYFRFLCDILLYKKNESTQGRSRDAFSLLDEFFSGDIHKNIEFMERGLDCWCQLDVDKFFNDRVSRGSRTKKNINRHERGKIITYFDDNNFFRDCVKSKKFSLGQTIMLYAFVVYLTNGDKISDADFRRRIRIVNNLVNNSLGAEISESESRQGGNRLPAIIRQIESIIIDGKILVLSPNFNKEQLQEEQAKLDWVEKNSAWAEKLFALEDHYLLYGQIDVVGLNTPKNFSRFISLFECDYDLIDCALLVSGNYFQHRKQLYQFGSKFQQSWQNLFHHSLYNENFEDTQEFLDKLLSQRENFTDELLKKIISEYLENCEQQKFFEWHYYYIKYAEFRPARYGKYFWADFENAPYLFAVYWTEQRWSENAYQPFLKAAVDAETFTSHYNPSSLRLEFDEYFIECANDGYVFKNLETGAEISRLTINQSSGVDTEDRIQKIKSWLRKGAKS